MEDRDVIIICLTKELEDVKAKMSILLDKNTELVLRIHELTNTENYYE
jgi:hypothetical protein